MQLFQRDLINGDSNEEKAMSPLTCHLSIQWVGLWNNTEKNNSCLRAFNLVSIMDVVYSNCHMAGWSFGWLIWNLRIILFVHLDPWFSFTPNSFQRPVLYFSISVVSLHPDSVAAKAAMVSLILQASLPSYSKRDILRTLIGFLVAAPPPRLKSLKHHTLNFFIFTVTITFMYKKFSSTF